MISSIDGFPWCVEILFRSSSPFIIGDCCPLLEAIVEDDVIWIVWVNGSIDNWYLDSSSERKYRRPSGIAV